MVSPKISVLIPAFNEEENLREAVESLIKARYSNLEIIIGVDDGNDKTLEVAKELRLEHKNVSFIYHPKRIGTIANMDSILKRAKGEIALKFDADMRVGNPKNFFSNIAKHFENEVVGGIAIFGYKNVKDEKLKKEIEMKKQNFITRGEYVAYELVDMFKKQILPLSKVPDFPIDIHCFRKSLIKSIDKDIIHDDAFFAYKVLEKGYAIENGSDVVIVHFGTPKSAIGLSNIRIKGKVGWNKISREYPLNTKKYYLNLFSIFLKNLKLFSIYDIIAFFFWLLVFSTSIVISKFNKNKPISIVWKKRT
jgi:glycosyltransferase involved in cell wall biosynthesis